VQAWVLDRDNVARLGWWGCAMHGTNAQWSQRGEAPARPARVAVRDELRPRLEISTVQAGFSPDGIKATGVGSAADGASLAN
jgi:hypothetical protein